MLAYELPLDPPCDFWQEYGKDEFIQSKIQEICGDISSSGCKTLYMDLYDFLYECVEQNLDKYLPEVDHGE